MTRGVSETSILGTIVIEIIALPLVILFEIGQTAPEEARAKHVALEVVALCLLVFGAMAVWSWITS